jgi:hypothetical protein
MSAEPSIKQLEANYRRAHLAWVDAAAELDLKRRERRMACDLLDAAWNAKAQAAKPKRKARG